MNPIDLFLEKSPRRYHNEHHPFLGDPRCALLESTRVEARKNLRIGCSKADFTQWQELLNAVETALQVLQSEISPTEKSGDNFVLNNQRKVN